MNIEFKKIMNCYVEGWRIYWTPSIQLNFRQFARPVFAIQMIVFFSLWLLYIAVVFVVNLISPDRMSIWNYFKDFRLMFLLLPEIALLLLRSPLILGPVLREKIFFSTLREYDNPLMNQIYHLKKIPLSQTLIYLLTSFCKKLYLAWITLAVGSVPVIGPFLLAFVQFELLRTLIPYHFAAIFAVAINLTSYSQGFSFVLSLFFSSLSLNSELLSTYYGFEPPLSGSGKPLNSKFLADQYRWRMFIFTLPFQIILGIPFVGWVAYGYAQTCATIFLSQLLREEKIVLQ